LRCLLGPRRSDSENNVIEGRVDEADHDERVMFGEEVTLGRTDAFRTSGAAKLLTGRGVKAP
jgi:hypothetical protein